MTIYLTIQGRGMFFKSSALNLIDVLLVLKTMQLLQRYGPWQTLYPEYAHYSYSPRRRYLGQKETSMIDYPVMHLKLETLGRTNYYHLKMWEMW